jgi:hypothetical protein
MGIFVTSPEMPQIANIIEQYDTHVSYADNSDRMTNSYSICHHPWKQTRKLFFHFLGLSVLNAFLLHKCCCREVSHTEFRIQPICELVQNADMTITTVKR